MTGKNKSNIKEKQMGCFCFYKHDKLTAATQECTISV